MYVKGKWSQVQSSPTLKFAMTQCYYSQGSYDSMLLLSEGSYDPQCYYSQGSYDPQCSYAQGSYDSMLLLSGLL